MDSKFLDYYNRELTYLREMGKEFSTQYPKIAGRLGMQGIDISDPYVERLMEGFAFLTSRVQLKMDAEFPRFSQRLLEIIYPNYLAPTPSMAIAELQPDGNKGDISAGFLVHRGSILDSQAMKKKGITCRYTTAHDVMLHPIKLHSVELGNIPADLPLPRLKLQQHGAVSALRIRLECHESALLHQLNIDQLMLYLSGPDVLAQQLLELMMQHTVGIVCQSVEASPERLILEPEALRHEGFSANQSLLPNDLRNFDGYRALQEYFAFPSRFLFFSINNMLPLFEKIRESVKKSTSVTQSESKQFEIILLLDQRNPDLEKVVDVSHMALHCTPIINLFPKIAERLSVNERNHEYHLVVDNIRPMDYEVFSVQRLIGSGDKNYSRTFMPFYFSNGDDQHGCYFSARREQRVISDQIRRHGSRTGYIGSEVYLSLVDEQHAPWSADLKYLSADILCTNRDIPLMLTQQEQGHFIMPDSVPIRRVVLKKGPTAPRPAMAEAMLTWQLISQLQLNYLSLMDSDPEQGTIALRQLLNLYGNLSDASTKKQIDGIRHCKLRPIYRQAPQAGPIVFARGIAIELTLDEQAFSGNSAYLLGSVLEFLFARLVSINTFTELTLFSQQRGEIARWKARIGKRMLI